LTSLADAVTPGELFVYKLIVVNTLTTVLTSVVLTDTLPAGVRFVFADDICSESGGIVTCHLGTLNPAESKTVFIGITSLLTTLGIITNSAQVSTNDFNGLIMTLDTPNIGAELSLAIAASPDPLPTFRTLTYMFNIHNAGPRDASQVTLIDNLPSQLQHAQFSTDGGTSWTGWTGSVVLGPLGRGASREVRIRATAFPSFTGVLTNTAEVIADEPDPDPTSNHASMQTRVIPPTGIMGAATAFDRTGQPLATALLDSPLPRLVIVKPKRRTHRDCISQAGIGFCRILPEEVQLNRAFLITTITHSLDGPLAIVRMEDVLPPNVQLVRGKLVRDCTKVSKTIRACKNSYTVKVVPVSLAAAGTLAAPVKAIPAGDGAITFLAEASGVNAIRVTVFNLNGWRVWDSGEVAGRSFTWNLPTRKNRRPASGIYLYVVTMRGYDGKFVHTQIKKLLILRPDASHQR